MPLHVPESLFEHYLYNNIDEFQKIIDDSSLGKEELLHQKFIELFPNIPEYKNKFNDWIKDERDLKDLSKAHSKVEKRNLEIDPNKFISLDDYIEAVDSEFEKSYEIEKEDIDKSIQNDKAIKNLRLKQIVSGKRGLLCIPSVDKSPEKSKKGQGLYIWTDIPFLYRWDGNPENLKIRFKFGQFGALGSAKTAAETISQYSGNYLSIKVVLYIKNLNDYFKKTGKNAYEVEHEIASALKTKGWNTSTETKSTEVYQGGTLKELIEIINKVLSGTTKTELIPRKEQEAGISKMTTFLENPQSKEFLLSAKMRYGKNITVLEVIKNLASSSPNFKNCLVITYKPSVFSSLKDDIKKYSNFKDFEVVDIREKDKDQIPKKSNKIRIFISSAQYALYGQDDENINESQKEDLYKLDRGEEVEKMQKRVYIDYEKNLDKIKDIHFGLIVADEYHYGTKSKNFQWILKQLSYDKIVYVSGTAMKDLATGRFDDDQVYNWTYMDEQKAKAYEKEEKAKNPDGYYPHLDMPTMVFYKMDLSPEAVELAQDSGLYTSDQGFSFTKLIDVDDNGKLVNEQLMRVLLKQIMDPDYGNMSVLGSNAKGDLSHMFWVMAKNVKGIKAVANLMREESMKKWFGNYEIIEATGNLNNDIDKVKNKIQQAENNDRGSITLSCYRFKEGTTVPEWHSVIMLDDGRSAEEYLQAIFRSQSPGRPGDDKDYCYVFDFNPERLLSIYHDIAQWNSKDGKEPQSKLVKEFLKYAPIMQDDGNQMVKMDADEVIEHFRLHGSFSEKMANDRVFNNENIENAIDEGLMEDLRDVSSKKNETKIVLNTHDLEKAKNAIIRRIQKENSDLSDEEAEKLADLEIVKEKIRNVLRTIPTFLFVTPEEEKTIHKIIDTNSPDLFQEICGVPPSFLKRLLDAKIINDKVINQTIEFISESISKLTATPTLEGAEDFIKRNLVMAGEETSTPNSIVNEMLDKLPESIWSDPNATFCDPVCGTGKFLLGIYERLDKGLMNEIPDDGERRAHIIENQIYGVDNAKYKTIITKSLLGTKGLEDHIINADSLKLNWNDMPKFDVVVGNPPYLRRLHLEFLNLAMGISKKYVIFVEPAFWLLNRKKTKKANIEKEVLDKLSKYKSEISLRNLSSIFPFIKTSGYGLVIFIDKSKKFDFVDVKNEVKSTKFRIANILDIDQYGNSDIYENLRDKILEFPEKLQDFLNKNQGDFYVNLPIIRGGYSNKPNEIMNSTSISFIPRDIKVEKSSNGSFFFSFKTKEEAKNFIEYLKTNFARFCLSIYKLNLHIDQGELRSVPWVGFTKIWTDENLYEYFGLSEKQVEFIENNTPKIY